MKILLTKEPNAIQFIKIRWFGTQTASAMSNQEELLRLLSFVATLLLFFVGVFFSLSFYPILEKKILANSTHSTEPLLLPVRLHNIYLFQE